MTGEGGHLAPHGVPSAPMPRALSSTKLDDQEAQQQQQHQQGPNLAVPGESAQKEQRNLCGRHHHIPIHPHLLIIHYVTNFLHQHKRFQTPTLIRVKSRIPPSRLVWRERTLERLLNKHSCLTLTYSLDFVSVNKYKVLYCRK